MEFVKIRLDYQELSNNLIDFLIEAYDVNSVIELLLNFDYTPDEVFSMDFAAEDIESVMEQMRENKVGPLV